MAWLQSSESRLGFFFTSVVTTANGVLSADLVCGTAGMSYKSLVRTSLVILTPTVLRVAYGSFALTSASAWLGMLLALGRATLGFAASFSPVQKLGSWAWYLCLFLKLD